LLALIPYLTKGGFPRAELRGLHSPIANACAMRFDIGKESAWRVVGGV